MTPSSRTSDARRSEWRTQARSLCTLSLVSCRWSDELGRWFVVRRNSDTELPAHELGCRLVSGLPDPGEKLGRRLVNGLPDPGGSGLPDPGVGGRCL